MKRCFRNPFPTLILTAALLATTAGWCASAAEIIYASGYGNPDENGQVPPGNGWIRKYSPDGSSTLFASGLYYPSGLTLDNAGNLYAIDYTGGNQILRFTPGGVSSVFASGNSLSDPINMAFDASGYLYVANYFGSTIQKFAPDGTSTIFAHTTLNPFGLAFDHAGNLFVSSVYEGTITKYTPNGIGTIIASGLSAPEGLAMDSNDNLFVAELIPGKIWKFTPSGVSSVFATGVSSAYGMAFDGAGNLFLTQVAFSILKFAPDGGRTTFDSGQRVAGVEFLAIQIPEPSTLALMGLVLPMFRIFRNRSRGIHRGHSSNSPFRTR